MEENTLNAEVLEKQDSAKRGIVSQGVPYPNESLPDVLATIDKLVAENGTGVIITKEDISKATGRKLNSLVLFFSTYQQFGILEKVYGKGFLPTALYSKYRDKVYPNDEREALLEMFKSPSLYAKIIEKLNQTNLPTEEKVPSLLKNEPYNVTEASCAKASKVFFDTARFLKIIDSNNKLVYGLTNMTSEHRTNDAQKPPTPPAEKPPADGLIRLPIHLPGENNRVAFFEYPKTLNKRDFKVIAKALTFVASSLITDEQNEDYELKITVTEEGTV